MSPSLCSTGQSDDDDDDMDGVDDTTFSIMAPLTLIGTDGPF